MPAYFIYVLLLLRFPSVLERKASLVAVSSVPSVVLNSPSSSPNKVMIPPVFASTGKPVICNASVHVYTLCKSNKERIYCTSCRLV